MENLKCNICSDPIKDYTKRIEEMKVTVSSIFYHEECFIKKNQNLLKQLSEECIICNQPVYKCQRYITLKQIKSDHYQIQFPNSGLLGPLEFSEAVGLGIYHDHCFFDENLTKIKGAENKKDENGKDIKCKDCGETVNDIHYRWNYGEVKEYYHGHRGINVKQNIKRCHMKVMEKINYDIIF